MSITQGDGKETRTFNGAVALKKPNLARFEVKDYSTAAVVSDGKSLITYTPDVGWIHGVD